MWMIFIGIISSFVSAQCDSGCLNCGTDGNCETCPSSLTPSGPSCVQCKALPFLCLPCGEPDKWTCKCQDPESKNICGDCPGDCAKCDKTSKTPCLVCPLGQFANSEGVCEYCPSPCYACSSLEICHSCQRGLYPADNFCCPKGCKRCDVNECYECEDPLILTNGYCLEIPCSDKSFYDGSSCVSCPDNCLKCDSLGCIECDQGLVLTDGQCVKCETRDCVRCQRGCEKCQPDGSCETCLVDWNLYSPYPQCLPIWCLEGCVTKGSNGLCIKCLPGYNLIVYVKNKGCCFKKCPHDHCLTSWFGTCISCPDGYYLFKHCCAPKCPDQSHCQKYDLYGWCTLCDKGYYLSKSGCCVKLCCDKSQKACTSIDIFGNCASCLDGWTLSNGCCLPKCEGNCLVFYSTSWGATCFDCDKECEPLPWPSGCCKKRCCKESVMHTIYLNGIPKGCFDGWYFDSNGCCVPKCPKDHISSVLTATTPPEWCFACDKGYVRTYTYCCAPNCCKESAEMCTGYLDGWCTGCKTGWALGPLGCCIPKCTMNTIVDYVTTDGTICYKCYSGTVLIPNDLCCISKPKKCCKKSMIQCSQIAVDGSCKNCKTGFIVDKESGCCVPRCTILYNFIEVFYDQINGEYCYRCQKGYKTLPNECCVKACDPISDSHCAAVSLLNICVKCFPGWVLADNCCYPKCPNGHCLAIENGFCKECETGYYLSPLTYCCIASCSKVSIANCVQFGLDGWCIKCKKFWYLDNNGCCLPSCPKDHCALFQNGWCVRCDPGYFLANYCCAPICERGHCVKMGLDGYCTQCEKNYYINPIGCCEPKCPDGHCIEEASDGWCVSCEKGYYLHNSFCCAPLCEKNYCAVTRWDGYCLRCFRGYSLNDQGCCIPNCIQDHCVSWNSAGWCISCEDNYDLSSFGCCVAKCRFDNCARVAYDGSCIGCKKGYFLNFFGCCVKYCKRDLCVSWGYDGFCDKCADGYSLRNDRCCAPVCPKGNCASMGLDDWCIRCNLGYYLNDKGCCQPMCDMPWLCEDKDGFGYCLKCPDGYYNHPNGCCVPECDDFNCLTFRYSGWCSACKTGLSIINGCCLASGP